MNRCQIEWANRQQDLIDSLNEDIAKFVTVSDNINTIEKPAGVILETENHSEPPEDVKKSVLLSLIWNLRNWNSAETKTITLTNQFLTPKVFTLLRNLYEEERDKQLDLLHKIQETDFVRDNCCSNNKCNCSSCNECKDFILKSAMVRVILERKRPILLT